MLPRPIRGGVLRHQSILQCLSYVFGGDIAGAGQIGNRAGHL